VLVVVLKVSQEVIKVGKAKVKAKTKMKKVKANLELMDLITTEMIVKALEEGKAIVIAPVMGETNAQAKFIQTMLDNARQLQK
jgi:heterodisulfide reductase subunit C